MVFLVEKDFVFSEFVFLGVVDSIIYFDVFVMGIFLKVILNYEYSLCNVFFLLIINLKFFDISLRFFFINVDMLIFKRIVF